MSYNLFAAALWLAGGLYLFFYQPGWVIRGTNVSFGWLCLAMAAYNLFRWWGTRSSRRERAVLPEEERRRPREPAERPPPGERDPNFDFGTPPRADEPR